VIVDDGSEDGTSEAVREAFPLVHVVNGSGNLYWGGAMRLAQCVMTASAADPDYLLWLNDDVTLLPDALDVLLKAAAAQPHSIIVGPLVDPRTQELTYSGFKRIGSSPLRLSSVPPQPDLPEADTFNGNVVLLPRDVYSTLGAIDPSFPHLYGDLDYGYRARRVGVAVRVAQRHVGSCARNTSEYTWLDASLGWRRRIAYLHSAKVMPLGPRYAFLRRHGGRSWPLRLVGGYAKAYYRIIAAGWRSNR
jgi:GT2 family glycosyltransferase